MNHEKKAGGRIETGTSLEEMIKYFRQLYGPRNRVGLPWLLFRVGLLNIGVNDLHQALREAEGKRRPEYRENIEDALARIMARIICVVDWLEDVDLFIVEMVQKYPMGKCAYCGQTACRCPPYGRSDVKRSELIEHSAQPTWSLTEWQNSARLVYGEANERNGVERCINRLHHEVAEIMGPALQLVWMPVVQLERDIHAELAIECADSLMWTLGIANLLAVDLEAVTISRYGNGCWLCHEFPCVCPGTFNMDPVHWDSVRKKKRTT